MARHPKLLLIALLLCLPSWSCGSEWKADADGDRQPSPAAGKVLGIPDEGESADPESRAGSDDRPSTPWRSSIPESRFEHPDSPHQPSGELPEPGFFYRMPGEDLVRYAVWESEETINRVLGKMKGKEGSCDITFTPGYYEIHQRILVDEVADLTLSGVAGTHLYFRDGDDHTTSTTAPVLKGDLTMEVADPARLDAGRRYQLYREDGQRDRLLEFEVKTVGNNVVTLTRPAHFMPHVDGIPAGSWVMEELVFFRILHSPGCTIQGFTMDGINRGGIRGHTIYTGIHANGLYTKHEKPTQGGLTVRNCTFKNLKGRGVVWYGIKDALIENNAFYRIRAQAIEIDHQSHGVVRHNLIDGAEIGVMVNDAFDSVVEGNLIRNCAHGVRFLAIVKNDFTNRGNIIRRNIIGPECDAGVVFLNEGMVDNEVSRNRFVGIPKESRIVNPGPNRVIE